MQPARAQPRELKLFTRHKMNSSYFVRNFLQIETWRERFPLPWMDRRKHESHKSGRETKLQIGQYSSLSQRQNGEILSATTLGAMLAAHEIATAPAAPAASITNDARSGTIATTKAIVMTTPERSWSRKFSFLEINSAICPP